MLARSSGMGLLKSISNYEKFNKISFKPQNTKALCKQVMT